MKVERLVQWAILKEFAADNGLTVRQAREIIDQTEAKLLKRATEARTQAFRDRE